MTSFLRKGVRSLEVAAQADTPAAGARLLYPKADGWYEKDSAGTESKVGPSAGGGGGSGTELAATTDYTNTQPASPTTGLKIFSRHRGRRLPSFVGPTGQDTRVQPHLITNNTAWMKAVNGSTTPTLEGMAVTWSNNATATPTAVSVATTSFFTSMVRTRAATTTSNNTGAGVRTNSAQWFLSSTANMGGFHFICRFGMNTSTTGTRGFVGLSSTTAALSPTVNPTTLLNQIGFAWNDTDTTMRFVTAGTATGTNTALGANFPINNSGVNFYEASIFAPSGGGQNVHYSLTRINDGTMVSNGTTAITGTTGMPALNLLLAGHVHLGNGGNSTSYSIDVQSMYIESDN